MKNIFVISPEDVRYAAKEKIVGKLTVEDLDRVKKGIEFGLECWGEMVITGINELETIKTEK